ncbi:hypothetical protein J5N97_025969 [Dioscorea zingiberensis]|uniref:Uncharacterized protein n=1 Tax=Dioscorea zingiberensis TaxID=325984 RepID=A0A9D5H6C0_9LILI|nr:hypothetical protein J5N97_025969 [Dioscorea zingiberensis]
MRSVEFGKCWPFDGSGEGRKLPPIELRKFRWWVDELEVVRKGEKKDGAGNEIVEDEKRGRGKQRAPKKRSIVELFAAAPPVETVEEETDGEEEEEHHVVEADEMDLDRVGLGAEVLETVRKRKERVKEDEKKEKIMKKVVVVKDNIKSKKKMKMKKKKRKNNKKQLKVAICAGRKEKAHESKVQSMVNVSRLLQDSVHIKRIGKVLKYPVEGMKKRPSTVKSLAKKQSFKHFRTSKLISRDQKDVGKVLPVHSILKDQTKYSSIKKSSMKVMDSSGLLRSCHDSVKHVSFSGKDDIIGHNKGHSPMELPQLQNLCRIFSDVLAASSAMSNANINNPSSSGEDIATGSAEKMIELSTESEKSSSQGHVVSVNLPYSGKKNCSDTEKNSLAEPVDLNETIPSFNPSSSTMSASHSGNTTTQISFPDGSTSNAESHVVESFAEARVSFPAPIRDTLAHIDAMSAMTIVRNPSSQQSASSLPTNTEANGRQPHSAFDPNVSMYNQIPEFQHRCSSDNMMSRICFSTGSKRIGESRITPNPASFCRERCLDNDFIGLPLNSHGEFIHLHSDRKFGFGDALNKQRALLNSYPNFSGSQPFESNYNVDHLKLKDRFPGISMYEKDQWLPEPYHSASQFVRSRSNFTGVPGSESSKIHNHEPLKDNSFYQGNAGLGGFCNGCKEHSQTQNCVSSERPQAEVNLVNRFQPSIQPTMRLMGKNVTVGKSSRECEAFDDGKVWTDKEIITEYSTLRESNVTNTKRWPQQEWFSHLSPGILKENFQHQQEVPSSFFQVSPFNHSSVHVNFDGHPQLMSRNGISSSIGNHGPRMDSFSLPVPSQELLDKTSRSLVNFSSGTESFKVGHHVPAALSHPQNVCHHMLLSSTHCKHSQSISYSTASTSHPSFLNQGYGNCTQPSMVHSSSNLPQWLLKATQQKKYPKPTCLYPEPIPLHHHTCILPGNSSLPLSSPCPSNISFHYGTNISQTCSSSNPASLVHPSLISELEVNKYNAGGSNSCRNMMKDRDGTKSKFQYFKELDHASRSRKRPAARDGGLIKPMKKPNLKVHEGSNTPAGLSTRGQFHGDPEINSGPSEFQVYGNKPSDVRLRELNICNGGNRSMSALKSKTDGIGRSGPLKLSAGAKHTLTPSQGVNQDKSMSIHATIPFAAGTSSSRFSVSQRKAAEVYRF